MLTVEELRDRKRVMTKKVRPQKQQWQTEQEWLQDFQPFLAKYRRIKRNRGEHTENGG